MAIEIREYKYKGNDHMMDAIVYGMYPKHVYGQIREHWYDHESMLKAEYEQLIRENGYSLPVKPPIKRSFNLRRMLNEL